MKREARNSQSESFTVIWRFIANSGGGFNQPTTLYYTASDSAGFGSPPSSCIHASAAKAAGYTLVGAFPNLTLE